MQLIEMARPRPMVKPDAAGAEDTQAEPLEVKIFPAVPGEVKPVPPLTAGRVPVTPEAKLTFVIVFVDPLIVLFVSVAVFESVRMLLGVMIPDRVVIFYSGCAGHWTSQGNPA